MSQGAHQARAYPRFGTMKQAFSQDLKSGRPKYAIGPAQMKESLEATYEKQNDFLQ